MAHLISIPITQIVSMFVDFNRWNLEYFILITIFVCNYIFCRNWKTWDEFFSHQVRNSNSSFLSRLGHLSTNNKLRILFLLVHHHQIYQWPSSISKQALFKWSICSKHDKNWAVRSHWYCNCGQCNQIWRNNYAIWAPVVTSCEIT